jgi:hypothetical protein
MCKLCLRTLVNHVPGLYNPPPPGGRNYLNASPLMGEAAGEGARRIMVTLSVPIHNSQGMDSSLQKVGKGRTRTPATLE